MSTTAAIAVIGVIATPTVAIAGYVFAWRQNKLNLGASRDLAKDTHAHEQAMAEAQRSHDSALRNAERVYQDKTRAYLTLLKLAFQLQARAVLTEPEHPLLNAPPPPGMPSPAEIQEAFVEINAFGSDEVETRLRDLVQANHDFFGALVARAERGRATNEESDSVSHEEDAEIERLRTDVNRAHDALSVAVKTDLGVLA